MKNATLFLCIACAVWSCGVSPKKEIAEPELEPALIMRVTEDMTRIMVHDLTNPPLACRFFAYATLAGYEVVAQNREVPALRSVLNQYPRLTKPRISGYSYTLASLLAMIETAKQLQPSGFLLDSSKISLLQECKRMGMEPSVIDHSRRYASEISREILRYAQNDGYRKISAFKRYIPAPGDAYWQPTPPAYMAAVEPYFSTLRPFFLDSGFSFRVPPPAPFSNQADAAFFQLAKEVYTVSNELNEEQKAIAGFWDCNPFAVQGAGHLQIGIKKISPGAHWMGIAGIACKKKRLSYDSTFAIFTVLATSMFDAFVCCWKEKYTYNRVRPETFIRKYIDVNWLPLLQTPPFPEYLSGHSVVSGTASTVLSFYLGSNFSYVDSVEQGYGLPPRKFSSFQQAAQEAAVSRIYGGIHFMDAIKNGLPLGEAVGDWVVQKVNSGRGSIK